MNLRLVYIFFYSLLILNGTINAQDAVWKKTADNTFELNSEKLSDALKDVSKVSGKTRIIAFPNHKGALVNFKIVDNSLLPKELQEKYPSIHSFKGVATDNSQSEVVFTCTANGSITGTLMYNGKSWDLKTKSNTTHSYILIPSENAIPKDFDFDCKLKNHKDHSNNLNKKPLHGAKVLVGDNQLRILRTAVIASGSYTRFFSIKQGVQSGSEAQKKAAALSGIVASLNRINVVFERDLGIRLELISNNDDLIFTSTTDSRFTDSSFENLSNLSDSIIDDIIGEDNYDIGHLLTQHVGGGLAAIGALCTNSKGNAVTGFNNPEGNFFDISFFSHELGHQLGANHTQNYDCERNDETGVEPGEGTTIMGYAGGPCGEPSVVIEKESDAYFHYVSIQEIKASLEFGGTCIPTQNLTNNLPSFEPLQEFNIPLSTAFALEALVTDRDNDALTYTWEQLDNVRAEAPPVASSTLLGPLFRSRPPSQSARRDFPAILGVSTKWEVLPSVPRPMKFGMTVRDGKPGGVSFLEVTVNAIDTGEGVFEVTSQGSNVGYDQNSSQEVTWNVAGTTANDIDVSNVKIELSFDGGNTYPSVLAESTPNDGAENIKIPEGITTSTARIRVSAIRSIFYAVNKSDFTIGDVVLPLFPEARVSSRQRKKDNLLVFRIKTSEVVTEDLKIFYSFQAVPSNDPLDFSGQTLVSLDRGDDYQVADNDFVILPANSDEIYIALPLSKSGDSNTVDKIMLVLNIPEGVLNPVLTSIGNLSKKQLSIKDNIIVHPNPSDGEVTLEILTIPIDGYDVTLYNLEGKLIFEYSFLSQFEILDFSSLSPGLYILSVTINGENAIRKVVIN